MAAIDNAQGHGIVQNGATVPVLLRALRQSQQHVQIRHGVRRHLDIVNVAAHFLTQQEELLILHLAGTLVRPQDGILHLLELRGNKALRVHQRLLALVIRGHFIVMALRYFNVITEDVIKANFQGINSRALALLLLQPCQPLLPVAGSPAAIHPDRRDTLP